MGACGWYSHGCLRPRQWHRTIRGKGSTRTGFHPVYFRMSLRRHGGGGKWPSLPRQVEDPAPYTATLGRVVMSSVAIPVLHTRALAKNSHLMFSSHDASAGSQTICPA